jgi:hypothetical protein
MLPAPQGVLQAPQWLESVMRLRQTPPHDTTPAGQVGPAMEVEASQ